MHSFIGPQLSNIASDIGENFLNESNLNNTSLVLGPRFLFVNELSFKHTGTFYGNGRPSTQNQIPIPADVMNLLTDLHVDDIGLENSKETVLKTHNDYWIVRKTNNSRHFYVIINKSSTLLEITEDAKRLFEEQTKNIFF